MRGANKARGKIIGGTIGAKAANADFLWESAENCGTSQPVREEEGGGKTEVMLIDQKIHLRIRASSYTVAANICGGLN